MRRRNFFKTMNQTNDTIIRGALINRLNKEYAHSDYRIIPELGVWHGTARIDIAVVNGILHGFEIKSDRDTLVRLHEQMEIYNSVFDKVTLVVGSKHLVEAFKKIPEWWGVEAARATGSGSVFFNSIREPNSNPYQYDVAIARLLWRHEALELLEQIGKAQGVRSKPREVIYERLAKSLGLETLKKRVSEILQNSREDWRSDAQPA